MDLTPYVDNLRRELAVAAEAGGAEARALAERLVLPLESATRLTLLEALSAAADEITRDLAPGSVDVRLRGRDPEFVVAVPDDATTHQDDATEVPPVVSDEGPVARINLRLPEHLKARVEEAAAREGVSVNAWLVRAAAAGLGPAGRAPGRTTSGRTTSGRAAGTAPGATSTGVGQRYTGWVR
ncbi:toxin-antitoxin system HicB family antitoxin [Saccharothrix longispora]|uniref:toxin-antitoxin system HicB family antitoxin n=1 Tax=Saccharothrix longispora TaxID=33920 RepID=UPI0028FD5647|nr:toxin-antitoxin system HicB family antitoxin [Saccharothrix longispora]MBY8848175.1 type II toxin-antitoxin system HicB family antitoxin [Saccharothrix sp. MB29]MDU0292689.1 toxin-antitoxin system HicB family antitoxin [Saccharothrix longispora]